MVLLTGATGKVGGELVKLVAARHLPARALACSAHGVAELRRLGLDVVVGDLDRPENLAAVLDGIERVFFLPANGPSQVA